LDNLGRNGGNIARAGDAPKRSAAPVMIHLGMTAR
jgi:hypothetical protein